MERISWRAVLQANTVPNTYLFNNKRRIRLFPVRPVFLVSKHCALLSVTNIKLQTMKFYFVYYRNLEFFSQLLPTSCTFGVCFGQ